MAKVAKKYVIANFHLITTKCTQSLTEIGVFHISKVIWIIFHSIVAKLCITVHQSCQEPETLSVGHFCSKNVVRPL